MIWVRGDIEIVQSLAARADVAHIYANPKVELDLPRDEPPGPPNFSPGVSDTIEWNILQVNADKVWASGYTGQGAVIGGQDTGYAWEHPALKDKYRGWDGAAADHNYHWHDAIHSSGGVCGPDSPEPCDDGSHGTHTMGSMVGDDGGANQIGMAPGARWIGCRNMDQGVGTPATYAECYQWFIAPTDLNHQNPRPDLAPDVINNSWSCPTSEGCTDPNILLTVVENVRAAGILSVHSAGNGGYGGCSTVNAPAAIYDASFTVGATDSENNIAGFSSRGPVTIDGSNRLKPDISAPGAGVNSSVPGGGYSIKSGTSMAAPHVAGLVALLISAQPALRGQVDALDNLIEGTALPLTTTQTCGDVPGTEIPNNTYGWGRIDAQKAVGSVAPQKLELTKEASNYRLSPGELLTYTLTITHLHPISVTTNVVITDILPNNTDFITATIPHNFDGATVQWSFPQLDALDKRNLELVIRVPENYTGEIINQYYRVSSEQVQEGSAGEPVIVKVGYFQYLPMITKDP
jgi:uncharacterized repeat protein (TIGR01451 family)